MKVLIVDDERLARERLRQLLAEIPDVAVVGEAAKGSEALSLVQSLRPDVLLLDIRMPGLDGLTLARTPDLPPVVFTTAHSDHAVEAFEVSAVDYLLKPIKKDRLRAALDRVRTGQDRATVQQVREALAKMVGPVADTTPRITARSGQTYEVFDARDITRFTAADKYVVFTDQGREIVIEETLGSLERRLSGHEFLRVHRSELINLRHVKRVTFEGRGCRIELADGQIATGSRRVVQQLKRRLGVE